MPDAPVEPTTEAEAGPAGPTVDVEVAGRGIIQVSLATAAVFTVASVLATAFPDRLRVSVAILDCVLFLAGIVVFAFRRKSRAIPFGPFLAFGTVVVIIFSEQFVRPY